MNSISYPIRYDGVYKSIDNKFTTYLQFYGNGFIAGCKLNNGKNGSVIPQPFHETYEMNDKLSFRIYRNTWNSRFGGDSMKFIGEIIDPNRIVIRTIDLNGKDSHNDSFLFVKSTY